MADELNGEVVGDREFMKRFGVGRHPGTAGIMLHFAWADEPEELEANARQIANTAIGVMYSLPDGPELTAGLRKLLEAKDCFARASKDVEA